MAKILLHKRCWVCPICDTEHDRDINTVGLVVSAYGGLRKSTLSLVVADEVESIAL